MLVFVHGLEFTMTLVMVFHIELTIMYYYRYWNLQTMWYRIGYIQM